jgi:hypothetical protein
VQGVDVAEQIGQCGHERRSVQVAQVVVAGELAEDVLGEADEVLREADAALAVALAGYLKGASPGLLAIAGYLVFTFAAIGVYLFANSLSLALGGKGLNLGGPLIVTG